MSVWGTIGNTLKTGAQKAGQAAKTGAQKIGNTLSKTPQTLDDLTVVTDTVTPQLDKITFDPVQNTINNMDNLTLDPNKKPPVDIDNLTFEDMLNDKEPQKKQKGQEGFAQALGGYDFQYNPSMIDYSPYMGLSPETQRYLYGGM
jgi:hypothetical protein